MKWYILLSVIITGCYTQEKAKRQFSRAAVYDPAIGAEFCALTFPARDSILPGTTITKTDTAWIEGEFRIDTVFVAGKPIEVTKTIILPGKVITNTIFRTDTIYRENTAALELSRMNERAMVLALNTEQVRANKYAGQAKKRLLALIGAGALLGLWLFFKLRRKK